MLRRLLSLILILSLLFVEIPAVLSETLTDLTVAEEEVVGEEYFEDEVAQDQIIKYRKLVRGDRDSDDSVAVVTLQNRLAELGYLRDSADGVFGQNTEKAITPYSRGSDGTSASMSILRPPAQKDSVSSTRAEKRLSSQEEANMAGSSTPAWMNMASPSSSEVPPNFSTTRIKKVEPAHWPMPARMQAHSSSTSVGLLRSISI